MTVEENTRRIDGLVEFCDFVGNPVGGQLTFARNFMKEFGGDARYVGLSSADDPIGRWTEKDAVMPGAQFFFVGRMAESGVRHVIPRRISSLTQFLKYLIRLRKTKFHRLYVQSPEALFGALLLDADEVIYRYAGISNPVLHSRYGWARLFAKLFAWVFYCALKRTNEILVTSSEADVAIIKKRFELAHGVTNIEWLPTLYDPDVFWPNEPEILRDRPRFVAVSRLNDGKGLDLILESFAEFSNTVPSATLTLVGDGEIAEELKILSRKLNIDSQVRFTGSLPQRSVAQVLRENNIFVTASHREGWPTAVVEAAASGLYIVSTELPSVKDIITRHGFGEIVGGRSQASFVKALEGAWRCVSSTDRVGKGVEEFSLSTLRERLARK